jgi:hypothetical protein
MLDFNKIPRFPQCNYRIDIEWGSLEWHLSKEIESGLDLDPDFQRGHVWTRDQQSRYVEYILRGGESGKDLYFNCDDYSKGATGSYVIVDGKQRLQAVRSFLRDDVPAFGYPRSQWTGNMRGLFLRFSWNVASLKTRADVLEWYLNFNSGGSVHTKEELDRVRALLDEEKSK